ncbi:MAG TPA: isoamylase early set domain-containing protein [Actinomycetota bacterium]|jgi:1,4-alpha-glucan branching enzyme|nr:isoamylase early set domain-containing protein [Actinomycetota bacterium]
MIRRSHLRDGEKVKVTFVLPSTQPHGHCSVVGDFNDWNPLANPLKRRSNRSFSANVVLPTGKHYRFRYLGEDGAWFDEEEADGYEPGPGNSTNSVLAT